MTNITTAWRKKVVHDIRRTILQADLQVEAADAGIGPLRDQEAPEDLSPQKQGHPLKGSRKGTKATALPSPVAQNRLQEVCRLIFPNQMKRQVVPIQSWKKNCLVPCQGYVLEPMPEAQP